MEPLDADCPVPTWHMHTLITSSRHTQLTRLVPSSGVIICIIGEVLVAASKYEVMAWLGRALNGLATGITVQATYLEVRLQNMLERSNHVRSHEVMSDNIRSRQLASYQTGLLLRRCCIAKKEVWPAAGVTRSTMPTSEIPFTMHTRLLTRIPMPHVSPSPISHPPLSHTPPGATLCPTPHVQIIEISMPRDRGRMAAFFSVGKSLGLLCCGMLTYGFGATRNGEGWRFVHLWCVDGCTPWI